MICEVFGADRVLFCFAGNVFGGTALSSYGGFWMGLAIILIPGGFEIEEAYGGATVDFYAAFALYVCISSYFTGTILLCPKPKLTSIFRDRSLLGSSLHSSCGL